MRYGLKPEETGKIRTVFSRYTQIEKAVLYGSRAKGNYRHDSDIDLVLTGKELNLSILMKIENDIDDLLLPYKVDLSLFHEIENQDLTDHIKRVGVNFYERNGSNE